MGNLNETASWDAGVPYFAADAVLTGGPDCPDNIPIQALTNRTAFLKKQIDDAVSGTLVTMTAKKLQTARTITMTGDGAWVVSFDGSGNATAAMALADTGVAAGTYPVVTVDSKGRVTGGRALTAADFPPVDVSKITGAASQTYVQQAISNLLNGAPGALDTLQELAAALGNDANFATTMTNALAGKATKATTMAGYGITNGVIQLPSGAALPATNIGPIWHDDYNSLMTWQAFTANGANYTGYASVLVGSLLMDTQQMPRPGYIKSGVQNLSRTAYAALRAWAMHNGMMVAVGVWAAGTIAVADNADGTTFRIFDVRGEFPRFWDDGRGVDASRIFGSSQTDALQNITGSAAVYAPTSNAGASGALSASGAGSALTGGSSAYSLTLNLNASSVARTSTETRPRNTAMLASIKF